MPRFPKGAIFDRFWFPTSTSPSPNEEGEAAWDSNDNFLAIGNGFQARKFYPDLLLPFSKSGVLSVSAGTIRFYFPYSVILIDIRAMVSIAPTGADLIIDVNKNGTTIFTTQANRPTIASGSNVSNLMAPDVWDLINTDYLTVDIDQVGSTIAGSDLQVVVRYVRA